MGLEVVGFAEGEGAVDVGTEFRFGKMVGKGALFLGVEEVFNKLVFGELQVDAAGMSVDLHHGITIARGAAAGGDNNVVQGQYLQQGGVLQPAERRFPVLLEKQGNGGMVFLFDVKVKVDEVHTKLFGEFPADGALSGTGEADEDEVHLV